MLKSLSKFLAMCMQTNLATFRRIDKDGNGKLDLQEFKE